MSTPFCISLLVAVLALSPVLASAHGLIGNRDFPSTLTFDDPTVGDELTLPEIDRFKSSDDGEPSRYSTEISGELERRLTDKFGVGIGGTYIVEDADGAESRTSGWDNFEASAKWEVYDNAAREFAASVGVEADLGGTGSTSLGVEDYTTITPAVYFGKGLNELPGLWQPLALTGAVGVGIPTRMHEDGERNPLVAKYNVAIQYSIPYLQQHVKDYDLPAPFDALTPLVEFEYSSPLNESGRTTGTINPGVIWTGDTMQLAAEATLPGSSHAGQGVGFRLQAHFFLEDLAPGLFGKPVFE